jgi:hypothetical protein
MLGLGRPIDTAGPHIPTRWRRRTCTNIRTKLVWPQLHAGGSGNLVTCMGNQRGITEGSPEILLR